jgi:DNA polymerase-3 subunit beta
MPATLVEAPGSLKAVCARKDLYEAVQTVAHAVSGRTSLPILSHVLIQTEDTGLRLTATDLELGISLSISDARVDAPGGLTAPAKLLTELLAALPEGSVTLTVDLSHAVRLNCEKSDYKILGLPADEYPKLPEVKQIASFTIHQRILRDMIRKTIFAVSPDEARAILTGILVALEGDTVKFVATDTHRLAVRTARVNDGAGSVNAIVPARAMNELNRILADEDGEVSVQFSENQVQFMTPQGISVVSRLIEGQYPNYERVVPSGHEKTLTLQTQMFQRAVKRAAIVARNNANRVVLKTLDHNLAIRAESNLEGSAYEEVEVAREGDDLEIAFNAKYLLDVLGVLDEEGFKLELTEPLKPGIARPIPSETPELGGDYLCVLMPMQIV